MISVSQFCDIWLPLSINWNFHYWRFNVKLFFCSTNQPGVYLYWIEKLERNKEVLFPFHQKHQNKKKQNKITTGEIASLQFTRKIKRDSKKEMQQFIHVWYLNCFLNRKWTCFIVCESCVFFVLSSGNYSGIRWGYKFLRNVFTGMLYIIKIVAQVTKTRKNGLSRTFQIIGCITWHFREGRLGKCPSWG